MRLWIVAAAALAAALAEAAPAVPEHNTAYDYLVRYGIPEAERIYKAEQEYLKAVAESRIVGGAPSRLGQIPYQAGLISDIIGQTGRGVCGGSLISASRVLTAAHCWFDGRNQAWRFTAVLGSTLLFSGGTRLLSDNVVMHPSWRPVTITNDVAVIYLPIAVSLSSTINVVSLPAGAEQNENFVNARAIASGFGITSDGGTISTNQFLSYVNLNVIANSVCSAAFPMSIQSSNICTSGAGGTSTCRGDSGGPLVVVRNNRHILIGVTSFGSALGCQRGFPAVFARVTAFTSFIVQHL